MAASVMSYPGSTRVGSVLDIRMRREARRSRAVLQAKNTEMVPSNPNTETSRCKKPVAKEACRTSEESKADLTGWLRTMKSFVLGSDPTNALVEKSLKLGTLPSLVSPSAAVLDPMEVLDDEFFTHSGGKDAEKEFHGSGILEYDDGSYVTGTWNHGIRHGPFTFDTNKQESEVSYFEGTYKDDCLEGLARILWKDGTWSEGFFKGGVLHGFARRFDADKHLTFIGMYRNGRPFGTCWKLFRCGGCVVGRVDEDGEFTGPDIAYLYPDLTTALVGNFKSGELVSGQVSSLISVRLDYGAIQVPTFKAGEGPVLRREISTNEKMTSQPLVPDPYETAMVEVRQSSVPGAEEGLFARRDVVPDTVLAFYNGVRSRRQKDGAQTWQNEANAYKIFDPTCKEGIVNIPPEYHQLSSYCASLAHKTNHSFVPNCEFGEFFHPRWGLVPCIVAKHAMSAGEEAFVWYGYDLDFCPDWYLDAWEQQAFTVPDSMRSEYGLS